MCVFCCTFAPEIGKYVNFCNMKKIFTLFLICALTMMAYAVPAYPGWQTITQEDGSTIEVRVIGDEFYHYTINRDGKEVRQVNGRYQIVGDAPSPEKARFFHEQARQRHYSREALSSRPGLKRAPQEVGITPNPAPKGVVIVVNFSDQAVEEDHTQAVFDELCNSTNCTVNKYKNKKYPSAAQYFADQSNGKYRPQFDVFGPVTLPHDVAHYGTDMTKIDPQTGEIVPDQGYDSLAADAVVEACKLVNEQYSVNWADYDSDNDDAVDFVYLIYAGKGQANGGAATTIWPHNWSIAGAMYFGNCTYDWEGCIFGGKYINNYACSAELVGDGSLSGIGTLCHEFSHVLGLPDLYDTSYGYNYEHYLTPNMWNIMDGGSYNGGEHCPPNYDPWEKYFMGWINPENLGEEGQDLAILANGQQYAYAYQINASGKQKGATEEGLNYYIENRQQQGWDAFVPGHGLLIWKVDFNADAWGSNTPNHSETQGSPLYTVVSSTPDAPIGIYNSNNNTFPGTDNVTSFTVMENRELTEIKEEQFTGAVMLKFNGGTEYSEYEYHVLEADFCTILEDTAGVLQPKATLTLTVIPDEGYILDDENCWLVEMGADLLDYGTGFTYDAETHEFRIEKVTANVAIVIIAMRQYTITWYARGEEFATTKSKGSIWAPEESPKACDDGRYFQGWCAEPEYESEDTAPVYVLNNNRISSDTAFYAVFAEKLESGAYDYYTTSCTPIEHTYYNIRFFNNGEQVGETQSIREGFKPALPANPTPECEQFTFEGWWTETLAEQNLDLHVVTDFTALQDQDYYAVYRHVVVPESETGKRVVFIPGEDNSQDLLMTKDDVKIEITKGTLSRDDNYRCYADGTMTVSATEPITQIVFTCTAKDDNQYGPGCFTANTGEYTYADKIGNWSGNATSVVFSAGRQVRMTQIEVSMGGEPTRIYYTTTVDCSTPHQDIINTADEKSAVKTLRNGQLVIIRGDKVYTVTGARVE